MAQATIGSLNVVLGMDAGDFNRAVSQANDSLKRLSDNFDRIRNMAGVAATLAAVGFAAGKITSGVNEAVSAIGDMVDMSQRLGVSVETLQGLSHAAELSGTSMEAVGKSMQKLAQNLTAIAGGDQGSKAAQTLASLGISATTASGQVKALDDATIEVADGFANMQDGAAKTAAAMNLFGKAGAEMIPMLNLGSAELRRLRDEADKLGFVLSGDVANGLEALGDQWATIGKAVKGFWLQLSGQLLPVFKLFTDKIQEWIASGGGVKGWANIVGDGVKAVAAGFLDLNAKIQRFMINLAAAGNAMGKFFAGQWSTIAADNDAAAQKILDINAQLKKDVDAIWAAPAAVGADMSGANEPAAPKGNAPVPNLNAAAEAKAAETEAQRLHNEQLAAYIALEKERKEIIASINPVASQLIDTQEKLGKALQKGAIDSQTFGIAMSKASAIAMSSYAGMASSIVGDLSKVFGESKGMAIAMALINTFQSVTNAWANVPYPLNIAAAAASLAAGMAQVANIKSTNKGGGGSGAASSGGSSGSAVEGGQAAGAQQAQGVYLNLQGQSFGREQIIGIIGQINEASKDGYRIVLSQGQS